MVSVGVVKRQQMANHSPSNGIEFSCNTNLRRIHLPMVIVTIAITIITLSFGTNFCLGKEFNVDEYISNEFSLLPVEDVKGSDKDLLKEELRKRKHEQPPEDRLDSTPSVRNPKMPTIETGAEELNPDVTYPRISESGIKVDNNPGKEDQITNHKLLLSVRMFRNWLVNGNTQE